MGAGDVALGCAFDGVGGCVSSVLEPRPLGLGQTQTCPATVNLPFLPNIFASIRCKVYRGGCCQVGDGGGNIDIGFILILERKRAAYPFSSL